MGKSIRSKSKIRNRNALRERVFGPHEAERIKRLAEKQRVTSGTTEALMEDADEAKSAAAPKTSTASTSMEIATEGSDVLRKTKKANKYGKTSKTKRVTVRNKKGRVMSKNVVKWAKQKRFKA
ncbi:hypothetical protein GQ54DRAFT_252907 [Martensiomyces pterosporus]|nr:hypothetical protein GQ54DRAFT_252907 [Martensiomyces pterosporus]